MRLRRVWRYPAVRVMLLAVAAAAVTALVITFVQERERIDVEAKSRLARKELAPHGETVELIEEFKDGQRDIERRVAIYNEVGRRHLDPGLILDAIQEASDEVGLREITVENHRFAVRLLASTPGAAADFAARLAAHERIRSVELKRDAELPGSRGYVITAAWREPA
ncbi:MAG: hypothetical protein GY719_24590 [bacterium]|nr:hypothetical protein [bacterium]